MQLMGTDYRNVTTDSTRPDDHTESARSKAGDTAWWRRGPILAAFAGIVVMATSLIVVLAVTGGPSDNANRSDAIRAVHGPTTVNNGVPSGYTRDEQGASTAAVNVLQAFDQASQGRIEMNDVRSKMIAADPGAALSREIELGSNRDESDDVMNTLPAAVHVSSFSPDAAQISVWSMTTTQSDLNGTGTVAVSTLWATTDISLVWQNGDWKAQDWSYRQGPRPEDASYPASDSALGGQLTSGYYTFYID
jgi:hypothetical protein